MQGGAARLLEAGRGRWRQHKRKLDWQPNFAATSSSLSSFRSLHCLKRCAQGQQSPEISKQYPRAAVPRLADNQPAAKPSLEPGRLTSRERVRLQPREGFEEGSGVSRQQ